MQQEGQDRLIERRDRQAVFEPGANVADADLERRMLRELGRRSHQIFDGSVTMPVAARPSRSSVQSFQLSKTSGRPDRGRSPMMIGRNALRPVSWPSQKGEEVLRGEKMRHEVADLVHQVDAQVGVLDPGMDMHPADRHPPRQARCSAPRMR